MADRGHELTDELIIELEERIADEYAKALSDMQKKLSDYLEKTEEERKKQKALLDAGKITKKEYDDWVYRHTMIGKRWEAMRDVLAQDLENANEIALKIARGEMPNVYALNANFGTYQIEHNAEIDTGFSLYNHDTAELLMREQDIQLMPGPSTKKAAEIAADKSMQWNRQKIQSAVLQGILQGESPYEVAKRLQSVATMNYNAAVRYARTMTTSAQNAGRYESFRRADKLGVDLTIEWQATLDHRTRHDHRMLHGQRRKVDEPFLVDGFAILYPAQSDGPGSSDIPQRLIWNCRCTLLAWVKGFEGETVKNSPKMGDMSFEEWQHAKEPKNQKTTSNKSLNIFGEEISFSEKLKGEKWDSAKRIINDLASEFDTKLKTVDVGADKGAGSVQISGTAMRLSNGQPATVIHEFAHSVSMQNQTKFGLYDEGDFWKEILAVRRRYRADVKDDVKRWISSYEHSNKSADEFMAEAFALGVMNEKGFDIPSSYGNDLTYANEVLRIIRKYFGRK